MKDKLIGYATDFLLLATFWQGFFNQQEVYMDAFYVMAVIYAIMAVIFTASMKWKHPLVIKNMLEKKPVYDPINSIYSLCYDLVLCIFLYISGNEIAGVLLLINIYYGMYLRHQVYVAHARTSQ